ncbi:MAG TPA: RNA polymerase sigma factor region1.1 domain-containing protein, partial [Stellaceae bacterium]|nr:RNA polymerase sigma factor region1.1 domain-containing protein [Stellaceae bacterium]
MLARGKERGYVTYDELNAALPPEQVSSEQIEDTMTMLSELGVNVVESEEAEEAASADVDEDGELRASGNLDDEDIGRTDDPVRMYLREMGSVELLSREGEIAIAKRIEAGREMMIGGLCESPLTIRALLGWRDALIESKMLLRDIVDLDATYGNVAYGGEAPVEPARDQPEDDEAAGAVVEAEALADGGEGEENEEEASISLAAMEAELLPGVLANLEEIASLYRRVHRQQEQRLISLREGEELQKAPEKRYERLRAEMVEAMKSIRFNNTRIEQLVDHLYGLNRRLVASEGKLLRFAEAAGVKRQDFLNHHVGFELVPDWVQRVRRLHGKGWSGLINKHGSEVKTLRGDVAAIASEAGLPPAEF